MAAVIEAGFALTGTWPIRTEGSGRMIAINALASSIILVCRRRAANARTATRREFVTALKSQLLSVREALALINQTLDEALAKQGGDFEADSRWAEGEYGVAETLSTATLAPAWSRRHPRLEGRQGTPPQAAGVVRTVGLRVIGTRKTMNA